MARIPVMRLEGVVELEVDHGTTAMADSCERVPRVERRGRRAVAYASEECLDVCGLFLAMVDLAAAAL